VPEPDHTLFDEFLSDFFAECDEHLTVVRRDLLALEPFVGQGQVERTLLEELFRSFHSIKGLAGMVGVREVEQLAHHMEEYLRTLRDDHVVLTEAALEALIDGVMMLEQALSSYRMQQPMPIIAPVLGRLDALVPAEASADQQSAPPQARARLAALSPEEQARVMTALTRGERIWRLEFIPAPALAERGINVNSVRVRLHEIGVLIRGAPLITDQGGIAFEFIVATQADTATFAQWQDDGITFAPYETQKPAPLPEEHRATAGAPPLASLAPSNVVRVDLARLDDLMRMAGEIVMSRARLDEQLAGLEALIPAQRWRALQETRQVIERQLRELRSGVMRVRMVAISEVFARMQFVVRDLAREGHRQVALALSGQDTEIDKFVVERMMDPLLHLVRNAVSHGLEPPDERVASGKSPTGTLTLRAATMGDIVVLEIEDDGRGINVEQVAVRARAAGLLGPNAALDPSTLLNIICAPGFSTRDQADRVSGRGIGMDVVLSTVEGLGGTLTLDTQRGRGTHFTIELPLTLAIVDALIVTAGGQTFAVPLPAVHEVIEVQRASVTELENNHILLHRGDPLPLVSLARLFRLAETTAHTFHALVVGSGARSAGIAVDRILGKREIVVRPMSDTLVQVAGVSGATELGDGRPVLILDAGALIRSRQGQETPRV
jgi:two-component system chemotaxis sensor kinase CheA